MALDQAAEALELLGFKPRAVTTMRDGLVGNGSWLVEPAAGRPVVLRRYDETTSVESVAYEHAVLEHLAGAGWVVPSPVSSVVEVAGALYCLTRLVPGRAVAERTPSDRARRGRDLARLDLALRGLAEGLGQRPGWRAQHTGVSVHTHIDWEQCLRELRTHDARLADWAAAAADASRAELAAIGAGALPITVIHGDFAEWDVHYDEGGRLVGMIDFGLSRVDSRPYELAIARTYRAPEAIVAYRDELARKGWPLTELEEAAIEPIHRAFRVDMVAWGADSGLRTGACDLVWIERQLERAGPL